MRSAKPKPWQQTSPESAESAQQRSLKIVRGFFPNEPALKHDVLQIGFIQIHAQNILALLMEAACSTFPRCAPARTEYAHEAARLWYESALPIGIERHNLYPSMIIAASRGLWHEFSLPERHQDMVLTSKLYGRLSDVCMAHMQHLHGLGQQLFFLSFLALLKSPLTSAVDGQGVEEYVYGQIFRMNNYVNLFPRSSYLRFELKSNGRISVDKHFTTRKARSRLNLLGRFQKKFNPLQPS
jgi:hypothetical protein